MTTTRLYLVRHGATQLSAEDRFSGDIGASSARQLSTDGVEIATEQLVPFDGIHGVLKRPLVSGRRYVPRQG